MKGMRITIDIFPLSWAWHAQEIGGVFFLDFGPLRISMCRIT
jgi:hypothetical protein